MLTEKEKEAVEKLDYFIYDISVEKFNDYKESSKVILNLVTKLQDEIIKLLKENRELTAITNKYEAYEMPFTEKEDRIIIASKEYFANGFFKNNFISKDKIKELEKTGYIEEECGYIKYVKIDDILRGESDEKL